MQVPPSVTPYNRLNPMKEEALERIAVAGEEYFWKFRHGWVLDQEVGPKGVSVSVWRKPDRTRELILDFPQSAFGRDRTPSRDSLVRGLRPAIQLAVEAGWDPDSRGREFRFNVPGPTEDVPPQ